ncbi:hypothetical protein [Halapricum desulfuricans]|uniref:BppU N-terminal domain-containing protein n=1 Tax=Halapricum desulfuricans TaxID=2841257 RepID=A0A897N1K2_9EURY|nr:hypothetical protein [Halapricum desulfuricans]QSG06391.1 hypothetical protein HSR121_2059 [Halapricum desulfuricans]
MTIQSRNITHYAGDSLTLRVTTKEEDGSRVDLTSTEIEWVLAESVSSTPDVVKGTSTGGITITDAVNGEFEIDLVPADTEALVGSYYHEAELRDAVGNEFTIFVGDITIKESAI